jgi:hypothetical protein
VRTDDDWALIEDAKCGRMNVDIPNLRKDGIQDRPSADELKLPTERLGPV